MTLQLIMRLLHIGGGIFWAGTMIFVATFLFPAIRDAGPEGAKVAAALAKRGFMTIMPIIALVTIASGLWLYWRLAVGFQSEFMRSGTGMAFGVGAACAILAFLIGIIIVRPAMMRAMALAQRAAQASPAERDAQLAAAQALRLRSAQAGQWVALLLGIAAAAMAVARYV